VEFGGHVLEVVLLSPSYLEYLAACAGGNWEGKKVTFGEEAAEEQQQQQQDEAAAAADDSAAAAATSEPKKKKQKKSSKQQEQSEQQQQVEAQPSSSKQDKQQRKAAADSSSKKSKKAKWAKLAVVQLQSCTGGVLKWKKLWPQLRAAAEQAGLVVAEDAKDQAWQKLQDSSQLQVNGKTVSLAA
jgi:chemotaxis response regulator CheB